MIKRTRILPLILLGAMTASAQPPPTTQPDEVAPASLTPSAEQMLSQMLRGQSGRAKPLQPLGETSVTPKYEPHKPAPATRATAPAHLLAEGTFLVDRSARLGTDKDGHVQFEFDPDATGNKTPPMRALPNLELMAMEHAVASTDRTLKFKVTGLTTEYRGKNYLLLTLQPDMLSDAPASASSTAPARGPTRVLSAEEMLARMLKLTDNGSRSLPGVSDTHAIDKTSGSGAVAPAAPAVNVLREGTFLVDRVGRLTKSPDGSRSEFTFEADGRTMLDPPVIVLPSVKLVTMEESVKGSNRDLKFRMTGVVTEYKGRNYVLPERVVAMPDAILQF